MEIDCINCPGPERYTERMNWIAEYLETGRQAYTDHYCHLWPGSNPDPYLSRNFTRHILDETLGRPQLVHWLMYAGGKAAGVCKIDLERNHPHFLPANSLFLEKIYFRSRYTGKGLGSQVLQRITSLAGQVGRKGIWLEAMQKGPALAFYQKEGFRILGETAIPYPEVLPDEKPMWVLGKAL